MGRKVSNMVGKKYGQLTVIDMYKKKCGKKEVYYCECVCDCGKENIHIQAGHLRSGHTQSCGCLAIKSHKKYNKYNLNGDFGIGYTSNTNKEFWFDIEDFDKIKNYCWYESSDGYIITYKQNKILYLHRLIMNPSEDELIDHIRHNLYDNRKKSLRICSSSNNHMNSHMQKNNTSGFTGVCYHKNNDVWISRIFDKVIGYYKNKEDAIEARKQAEEKYFKEWSFKNSNGFYNNEIK